MIKLLFSVIMLFVFAASNSEILCQTKYETITAKDKNGYSYQTVAGDHLNCRIYKLDNGLTVFLRQLKDEPRIQTYIAVKAGATYDPKETTGLAHYLEHMMFKGTSEIGTSNWEAEKVLLAEISDLFEQHKATNNPDEKRAIYRKIDSVSQLAAKHAVPSEYDKMISGIGAKGTNAYTSNERTVYVNDIPANELERWLTIESERFGDLVLRLFHTELETVYEEYNMYQDEDRDKVSKSLMGSLFKNHPYGTQTVIGDPEHLKNPSMVNIHNYFDTFYVPSNMAVSLSGDLDFEETIKLIDKYFGRFESGNPPRIVHAKEAPITAPIINEVFGPGPAYITIGYRYAGYSSKDRYIATLIDYILNNSRAGLIDLNLVKSQKVLRAYSYTYTMMDYSVFMLSGSPREGQELETVKDLLLAEIEKVKKGDFDEWLIEASINDMKLNRMRAEETNNVAHIFVNTFTNNLDWAEYYSYLDELSKITKADIVKFATETFKNNYVVVNKRTGTDPYVVKVEKPEITAIQMNREAQSNFYTDVMARNPKNLEPVFLDYDKDILRTKLKTGIEMNYIKNEINDLFQMYFILDMGSNNDLKAGLAARYLPYLGTNEYSPDDLSKEFFKLGISMSVSASDDRIYVTLSGLEENLDKGLELLEHTLANAKPDKKIYDDYVDGILKSRANSKLDRSSILWGAMFNFGKYGDKSPFKHIIAENELKQINPKELTDIIKGLFDHKHYFFYYGSNPDKAKTIVEKHHKQNAKDLKDYPPAVKFVELEHDKNVVYVVDFDMVQSNILMISKDRKFDRSLFPDSRMFSEYFGGGLSSIVFQEIRESRALAYSAFASYATPAKPDESHFVYGFVGTQPDKLKIATDALLDLMNNMPKAEMQFNQSRDGVMRKIETERITKSSIFWNYISAKERGIKDDIRKEVYKAMPNYSVNELEKFFNKHIKGKNFTFLILANKSMLDYDVLKEIGEVKEISLEELFGY